MPENTAEQACQTSLERWEDPSGSDEVKWTCYYGLYKIRSLAQDQFRVKFPWGGSGGILKGTPDIQSDDIDVPSAPLTSEAVEAFRTFLDTARQHLERESNRAWGAAESLTDEGLIEPAGTETASLGHDVNTAWDDVSQWTSAELASGILEAQAEPDMPRLRKMILIAEDTSFTVEQSIQLAPWFLDFAERRRDSDDPQDETAVLSAIRTGASMLTPDAADSVRSLLQPGHSIETSLVALKMLGRIFEAQPPTDVDQHTALAGEVSQIAKDLLTRYAITVSQSAAMAHLAIYALAAMASSETPRMVEIAQGLDAAWFTRRTQRKLRQLRDAWASRAAIVPDKPLDLLNEVIETLGVT